MALLNTMRNEADNGGKGKMPTASKGNVLTNALNNAVTQAAQGVQQGVQAANNAAANAGRGGGGGGGSSSSSSPARNYDTTVPSVFGDTKDYELLQQYQDAMAALEQMKGQAPTYGSQYDAQIQELYNQIIGRGPFKYDSKTDPLYQQYVQDAVTQGKMAMRDTMGQAAALTGGYGSSYGQAVGQQKYDQYLQGLADILPQTYGMALNAYNAEGDRLNQQLATTTELEQSDYAKYLNQLNQYNIDLDRAISDANMRYDRAVAAEKQNYNRQFDQYELQQDYLNRLSGLISMGYKPSKEDYARAGLSEAQGAALTGAYMPKPQTVYVTRGDTGNTGSTGNAGSTGDTGKAITLDDLYAYKPKTSAEGQSFLRDMSQAIKDGTATFTEKQLQQWANANHV